MMQSKVAKENVVFKYDCCGICLLVFLRYDPYLPIVYESNREHRAPRHGFNQAERFPVKPLLVALLLARAIACGQTPDFTSPTGGKSTTEPGPIETLAGIQSVDRMLTLKISNPSGGTVKSWYILAPPRGACRISVDGTIRFSGRFGNLFMSRASTMPNATGNDGFTSRYFSVTNTGMLNGYTAGHNAYFDIPFRDSVNITITGDTAWVAFYNIFYEIGRRNNGRYNEFYACTGDSIPTDASINDTLLALNNAGKGLFWSLYYWMVSDSTEENNRAYEERDFYCVPDGRPVHLSTGTEDYCGYYYNWQSAAGLGSRTTDFHGSPTFGRRTDGRYLDAFYRIHELDRIPFDNTFVFYWEAWDGWPKIPRSRYCHVGYCIIYYLERSKSTS